MQAYSPQVVPTVGASETTSPGLKAFFAVIGIIVLGIVVAIYASMQRHLVSDQAPQTSSLASYMQTAAPGSYAWLQTHPGSGGAMQCQRAGANPMQAVKANNADASGELHCLY